MRFRLKHAALLTAALVFTCGCGQSRQVADNSGAAPAQFLPAAAQAVAPVSVADSSCPAEGGFVDERLRQILLADHRSEDPAVLAALPDFPALLEAGRGSSAVTDSWVNGSAFHSQDGGSVEGNSLLLSAAAGGRSWAIYALNGPEHSFQLKQLKLDIGIADFSGSQPGYWVLLGDFARQRWAVQGRFNSLNYTRALNGDTAFLGPGKQVYLAVVLLGTQSMTIARAGLSLDGSPWQTLELASGPGSGITPAVDFSPGGAPAVVWANSNGTVSFAVCDRGAGFANPASWAVSTAENDPFSASVLESGDPESPGAKAQWLDMLIDPDCALPRISLLYTDLAGTRGNSRIGCTVLGDIPGTGLRWLNYRLGFTDSAYWTSIARDPTDFSYMIALTAGNQHRSTLPPPGTRELNDMEVREIFWLNPVSKGEMSTTAGTLTYGFGNGWTYPHLRIRNTGLASVAINGGIAFAQQSASNWSPFLTETASGAFGSLVFAPDNTAGTTYSYSGQAGQQVLHYADFNQLFNGLQYAVDSLPDNAANNMAAVSQLGYLPDGRACIAYTQRTAAGVAIRFALQNAVDDWTLETISPVNSTPVAAGQLVFLDLAVDSAGIPAVCWTQWNGSATSMMVALRGT